MSNPLPYDLGAIGGRTNDLDWAYGPVRKYEPYFPTEPVTAEMLRRAAEMLLDPERAILRDWLAGVLLSLASNMDCLPAHNEYPHAFWLGKDGE